MLGIYVFIVSYHLWAQDIYCLSKIIPITFPAFYVVSLNGVCVSCNGYSQGIHANISKKVTHKMLKTSAEMYYGH